MHLAEKEEGEKGEKIMYKKHFYAAVILVVLLAVGIQPAHGAITHILSEGVSMSFGSWEDSTFTFNSITPVPIGDSIQIASDSVIIDGAGNTISGASGTGVILNGRTNVTIKNLTITGCGTGIDLLHSGTIYVTNNSITNCQWGIRLIGAGTCTIEGNIVSGNSISNAGIVLGSGTFDNILRISVNNELYNNTFKNNGLGIEISNITLTDPLHTNRIFNNNFLNNEFAHAKVTDSQEGANVFHHNYWDDYYGLDNGAGGRSQGDRIGDTDIPHLGLDNFPWVVQDGWNNYTTLTPQEEIVVLIDYVVFLNFHHGIENSLDAKLDAALNALDDTNENNDGAAINSLNAFINAVQAQSGNKIDPEDANALIAYAQEIIDTL
jgi:parallel beta-helix repeat protein